MLQYKYAHKQNFKNSLVLKTNFRNILLVKFKFVIIHVKFAWSLKTRECFTKQRI